jgi:Fe-S-cluster containining protein
MRYNTMSQIKNFEKAFYSDGYKIGMKAVLAGITQETMFSALNEMYYAVDDLINTLSIYANKEGRSIDCKKGCEWCCHQPIYALSYEMEYLNAFVKTNFDKQKQDEIKSRAKTKDIKLKSLNEQDLQNSKHPCPLLENGSCIAYQARPMACRIYLSSNVNTCLKFYKNPTDEKSIPALLDFPLRAGRMMNEGFKAAIKTGGLPSVEFRIEEILLVSPVKLGKSIT